MSKFDRQPFARYQTLHEIYEYLDNLERNYSDLVKIQISGYSYERRPIKTVHISKNSSVKRPCVFIDAGIHAREWLTNCVALYCVHQLVVEHQKNGKLLDNVNWIILPVANPDGYEYTHTVQRYWRKTRKPNLYSACVGTDLNRNFDIQWHCTSKKQCLCIYGGDKPFSEPEAQTIKHIMESIRPDCIFYLSLHSYAKALLYPCGYTNKLPNTWRKLNELAKSGSMAIQGYSGRTYRYGNTASCIQHLVSGSSADYAFEVQKIPHVITMELPAGGKRGFNPSNDEILPLCQESWVGIEAMVRHVNNQLLAPAVDTPKKIFHTC